jgi:hypothetical protein
MSWVFLNREPKIERWGEDGSAADNLGGFAIALLLAEIMEIESEESRRLGCP